MVRGGKKTGRFNITMKRPFITHSKPWIDDSDVRAMRQSMSSGMIAAGDNVREFEEAVAGYYGTAGCVAAGSGTAAIILALKALKIGTGDEVILPTYVCVSVANAVRAVGATPILCDVGKQWNMTPKEVEPHISKKTKAIIVVHIFGIAADTAAFLDFGVPVIEDCCQAFGSLTKGTKTGTVGTFGIFSFNAIKCLTTGEGGMATSIDPALVGRMRELKASNEVASPMSDMQAALGLNQLARYDEILKRRLAIAERYFERLPKRLTARLSEVSKESIFFRFPLIVSEDFEALRRACEERGFAVRKGVDALIHRQFGLPDEAFPNACELFKKTLSLPIYPALKEKELEIVLKETARLWTR